MAKRFNVKTAFDQGVREYFTKCGHLRFLDFYAAYFLCGFTMDQCVVEEQLSFQSGGHNDNGVFRISDTTFRSFVDFEDCWFTGSLHLQNVTFEKGTNLFGNKNTPMEVSFDVTPELANVSGSLDLNTFTRLRDSPPPDPNTQ